jgi:hypothetical protein
LAPTPPAPTVRPTPPVEHQHEVLWIIGGIVFFLVVIGVVIAGVIIGARK